MQQKPKPISILETQLDQDYNTFLRRIQNRLSAPHAIEWLFQEPTEHFKPDYLELKTVGNTSLNALINQTLGLISPHLWHKLSWPKIKAISLNRFDTQTLNQLLKTISAKPYRDKVRHHALKKIHQLLNRPHPLLPKSTFTEYFHFLTDCTKTISNFLNMPLDIYKQDKHEQNTQCIEIFNDIRETLLNHPNGIEIAAYLSVRSNWIDSLEKPEAIQFFLAGFKEEINELIDNRNLILQYKKDNPYLHLRKLKLLATSKKPKKIIYECDNSGEIILDLLFIEFLLNHGHSVTITPKESPILNDVTQTDIQSLLSKAEFDHLMPALNNKTLRYLHTNSEIPGKYVYDISNDYKKLYEKCDLVILKGQGNFQTMPMGETLRGKFRPYLYKKPLLYMMSVKANLIQYGLRTLFGSTLAPKAQSPLIYYFNPENPATYPKQTQLN